MAKKNRLYVTTMHRWGEYDNHSYNIYVGGSKSRAISEGEKHQMNRGGKYSHGVAEWIPNELESGKLIVDPMRTHKQYLNR